jgi:hypothetical protein
MSPSSMSERSHRSRRDRMADLGVCGGAGRETSLLPRKLKLSVRTQRRRLGLGEYPHILPTIPTDSVQPGKGISRTAFHS